MFEFIGTHLQASPTFMPSRQLLNRIASTSSLLVFTLHKVYIHHQIAIAIVTVLLIIPELAALLHACRLIVPR